MKKKRVVCIIAAILGTMSLMLSSCQNFPGGNLFDEKALKYLDMEWFERPDGVLEEEDNTEINEQYKGYRYTASLKGEEYYFDYVNNLFSELMTRYKYVTYETDYKTVRHDLLYIDDYRLVSESDNLDNYMSEYENLHFGYYGFEFKAIVADKIYYPNDEFYPGKGKATKMKKSTIITVRLSIPLNYDADAMHKDTLLSIIVDKNDDCSYLEQYIQY